MRALLLILLLAPSLGLAAAPTKKLQGLLDKGKAEEAAVIAQKWLQKNEGKEGTPLVRDLLAEAEWCLLLRRPSLEAVRVWRGRWPGSPHGGEAATLEANQALLAAMATGTEEALASMADLYPGSAAADDGYRAAESAAWSKVQTATEGAPLAAFLSRHPSSPHRKEALELFRAVAWREAESANTVAAWVALRATDPEHPRATEARLREEELAWTTLGDTPAAPADWKFARRYWGSARAVEALNRAMAAAEIVSPGGARSTLAAKALTLPASPGIRALQLNLSTDLPSSLMPLVAVELQTAPGIWQGWDSVAQTLLAERGIPVPAAESPGAPGATTVWHSEWPLCVGRNADGTAPARRFHIELRSVGEARVWDLPIEGGPDCASGPLIRVARDAGGTIQRSAGPMLPGAAGAVVDLLGMSWRCEGPLVIDGSTVWMNCGGWQVAAVGGDYAIRAPTASQALVDRPAVSPTGLFPADLIWTEVVLPPVWYLGGAPGCYWPTPVTASTAPPVVRPPPARPSWVEGGFVATHDLAVDLDADGAPERLLVFPGRADPRSWLVWVPDEPDAPSWIHPLPVGTVVEPLLGSGKRSECGVGFDAPR